MISYLKICMLLLLSSLLGHALKAIQNPEGAIEVRIPTYDHNGRISWELEAEEVDVVGQSIYSAKNPKMFILENQKPSTVAKTSSGIFNIGKGIAQGDDNLLVEGEGFQAIGRPWTFEENIAGSKSHLAFAEQGKIGFEEGVDAGFVRGVESQDSTKVSSGAGSGIMTDAPMMAEFSQEFPTTAYGEEIHIYDLGGGKKRFLLQKNVFIRMEDTESNCSTPEYSTINCERAEILLGPDDNGTKVHAFGKISQIHATGTVKLNQPSRRSSADELKWSQGSGRVDLFGNAKVFHKKWGAAEGEKIVISQKDGRAEVIGGKQGRSRLLLPALNKSKFPK